MAAWNIFGRDTTPEQLPDDLRAILADMKRERVAFENLTTTARESGQNLTQLMQPVTEAQKVIAELQSRIKSLERLVPVLATLDEQTENVSKTQRRTETQITENSTAAKQLRRAPAHPGLRPGAHTPGRSAQVERIDRDALRRV